VKRLFVTGTDTGVGKTTVGCALAAAFARRGRAVAVMKPFETGDGDDAARLAAATGRALDLARVGPYRFPLPASPEVAARAAGATVELSTVKRAFAEISDGAELILVEGAGGLLVPISMSLNMADLARALALPLLIVARPSLGTVNHTLLTLEAARARDLRVAGVIFSRTAEPAGPDEPTNPDSIARYGGVKIFGTFPRCINTRDNAELAALAERHLDLDALWDAL
jgi:dethiobiotin synthetase